MHWMAEVIWMGKAVQFTGLTMTGLLAGNELGTLIGSHPALRALPLPAEIQTEQVLTTHLGKVMPPYMVGTMAAAVAAAVDRRGTPGFPLAVSGAGATVLMLAITLIGNLPLNARTVRYPADGDAPGWVAIRRRWERLHTVRVVLDLAAFGAMIAAALSEDERAQLSARVG